MSCTKVSFSYNYIDVPNEIEFGNKVSLDRGVIGRAATGGAKMVLFWRSMVRQRLDYLEGVHVVGKDGKILALEDHPLRGQLAKVGECWSDTIYFPAYELEGANAIGVALVRHNSSDLLEIGRGPRDWGNHRLLIPLHQQAVALQE